jgi:hypothetical protein
MASALPIKRAVTSACPRAALTYGKLHLYISTHRDICQDVVATYVLIIQKTKRCRGRIGIFTPPLASRREASACERESVSNTPLTNAWRNAIGVIVSLELCPGGRNPSPGFFFFKPARAHMSPRLNQIHAERFPFGACLAAARAFPTRVHESLDPASKFASSAPSAGPPGALRPGSTPPPSLGEGRGASHSAFDDRSH